MKRRSASCNKIRFRYGLVVPSGPDRVGHMLAVRFSMQKAAITFWLFVRRCHGFHGVQNLNDSWSVHFIVMDSGERRLDLARDSFGHNIIHPIDDVISIFTFVRLIAPINLVLIFLVSVHTVAFPRGAGESEQSNRYVIMPKDDPEELRDDLDLCERCLQESNTCGLALCDGVLRRLLRHGVCSGGDGALRNE